ncbi:hypothetical protein [Paenibacillus agilis]|uniref:Uncharacterized protein n=1 Tax=Paenibacillus agilis TaxID=3020863 RepID=A0A559IL25_9BACL|nr:hypothetical protein [Paenibacillus agilis]TVX88183.1 hypothetical protein FPZ44_19960 [Paenibacillus agilis]
MKRSDLFYIWAAVTGYLTGIIVYIASLWALYGETFNEINKLITWTAPAFFTVGLLLYSIAVAVLRSLNRYSFWLQTLLFVILGFIPVMLVPIMMGFLAFTTIWFVFSPEGMLFMLAYTSIALVCSYGFWVAHKRLSKKPFTIFSIVILALFIYATI